MRASHYRVQPEPAMKTHALLLLLLCVCAHGAPTERPTPGSCKDPAALGAAKQAMTKINQDRKEGYVLTLNRLCNVNQMERGPMGMVYYLTMDVLETTCHVLSKKDRESCDVRDPMMDYGQCKATIYINRVQREVTLYSYSCSVRPVPVYRIFRVCPDCPVKVPLDGENILETTKQALEEFNRKSGLANYFALLNVTRASIQRGIGIFDNVEFIIQETVCANNTNITEAANCKLMNCEFAHKGLCKGSKSEVMGNKHLSVECEILEPEGGEKEKSRHLLGGEHNHSHAHDHDHKHDHTHDHDHKHGHDHDHKHGHDHDHKHGHDHDHDHTHGHTHDHDHKHNHTDEHGHEHDHKHLHAHEHHHHHHDDAPKKTATVTHGVVRYLPPMDDPTAVSSLPDQPDASEAHRPVTLPVFPDAHGSHAKEPAIPPFPNTESPQCPGDSASKNSFIEELFNEDPLFQHKAH
ncbi:fetuin B [Brienomyrus brachyistius]|uniref:fetuin B n=1 Tax=Brienomyrus brachyistius TaxID=42636 RepID=UPI0020B3AAB6|nr:fetuin B [Brienomyrus brachyistius]